MKKLIYVLLIALSLCSCTKKETAVSENVSKKINIVTTIFPAYDFARNVTGDLADVKMLLPPGAEAHSFEPTAQDIIAIQNSDLFVYIGGEGDEWIADILESMGNKAPKTFAFMDYVKTLDEVIVEGMQAEEEEEEHHDGEEEHEHEYDEHVWTSPKNAIILTESLAKAFSEIDGDNKTSYEQNASSYVKELEALDKAFEEVVSNAKRKTILVADRFPFRYFTYDYGITYYAAFPGCSTNADPSVATITFLTDKTKEENLPCILHIEYSNMKVAQIISESTGCPLELFHSCHTVSKSDMENGMNYLSLMKNNVEVLRKALN